MISRECSAAASVASPSFGMVTSNVSVAVSLLVLIFSVVDIQVAKLLSNVVSCISTNMSGSSSSTVSSSSVEMLSVWPGSGMSMVSSRVMRSHVLVRGF